MHPEYDCWELELSGNKDEEFSGRRSPSRILKELVLLSRVWTNRSLPLRIGVKSRIFSPVVKMSLLILRLLPIFWLRGLLTTKLSDPPLLCSMIQIKEFE